MAGTTFFWPHPQRIPIFVPATIGRWRRLAPCIATQAGYYCNLDAFWAITWKLNRPGFGPGNLCKNKLLADAPPRNSSPFFFFGPVGLQCPSAPWAAGLSFDLNLPAYPDDLTARPHLARFAPQPPESGSFSDPHLRTCPPTPSNLGAVAPSPHLYTFGGTGSPFWGDMGPHQERPVPGQRHDDELASTTSGSGTWPDFWLTKTIGTYMGICVACDLVKRLRPRWPDVGEGQETLLNLHSPWHLWGPRN